jgi:hypothetical protein
MLRHRALRDMLHVYRVEELLLQDPPFAYLSDAGSQRVNVEPSPTTLRKVISPPSARAIFWLMASPSPAPCPLDGSSRLNSRKSR